MRFWRKPKNRRFERESVLDVKLRVQPAARARRRFVLLALTFAILAVGLAGLGLRGWDWARQRLLSSHLFSLTSIEISTDGIWLKPDQIRQWAGIQEGDNLLLIDLPRIRRDLELIPQVESAAVERVLPHVLRIQVTERDPVLQIQAIQPEGRDGLAPATFYLDRAAVVMPPLPLSRVAPAVAQAFEALPILRGVSSAELRPGTAIRSRQVDAALRLVAAYEPSPLATQVELQTIDIASPQILRVITGQGAEIVLAYDQIEQGLERWRLVHEAGLRRSRAVASLDLAVTNNCPVLWLEASSVPPVKPKPTKPLRLRRKHV